MDFDYKTLEKCSCPCYKKILFKKLSLLNQLFDQRKRRTLNLTFQRVDFTRCHLKQK